MSTVIIVDPISTGGALAAELHSRGIKMICVWSSEVGEMRTHVPDIAKHLSWLAVLEEGSDGIESLALQVQQVVSESKTELVACLAGGEPGVLCADALSSALNLRSNGVEPQRRNKSWQQKAVRAAGLRATREASGTSVDDACVQAFLSSEQYPIIVKPTESAGSDGVKKCATKAEAEAHFEVLMHAQHRVGSVGAAVICQEFLAGDEYVVDHASRDGEHKLVMIWKYDRRPCNGGDFVLFSMVPVPSDAPEVAGLVAYTRGVLDALSLKHGASHAEVMLTADGPCLVEMNCRAHGADGVWAPLARALTGGYSQLDAAADAALDAAAFEALPGRYGPFKAAGQFTQLVSRSEGTIASLAPLDAVRALPSFQHMQVSVDVAVGRRLVRTVDLFTAMGFAIQCHDDPAIVAADVAAIRAMEEAGALVELVEPSSSCSSEADAGMPIKADQRVLVSVQ
ncbi:hypothetical protein EMIHUDRAFT_420576 [Emiliania huxleyi CCMP1516]|uniref:ATP-grasp domain-containing protein n=2 Tax=Emiliania huxleyi TaxID=2903 RepID=A0A0D3IDW3_EMIH1|nr:hypothetical protein EMIHUDRAFT_420576 [Emiliania huxleyi CCMP1516]EOD09448.1 hypothetical protein EMIHUDRAFT_420576 [Emiliania huxleyi CCMP1516]|eukprot:XP_005761877.1 hypothetical protein EMIHUDRAFT_420576 [Emiliania huxleyi CCMP1516]